MVCTFHQENVNCGIFGWHIKKREANLQFILCEYIFFHEFFIFFYIMLCVCTFAIRLLCTKRDENEKG